MSTGFIGMDPAVIRRIGADLQVQANNLVAITSAVDGSVSRSLQLWQGQDAVDFSHLWASGYRPKLEVLRHRLEELAKLAGVNADEQERESGDLSGTAGAVNQIGRALDAGGVDGHSDAALAAFFGLLDAVNGIVGDVDLFAGLAAVFTGWRFAPRGADGRFISTKPFGRGHPERLKSGSYVPKGSSAAAARWAKLGKFTGPAGNLLSGLVGGYGQYSQDRSRTDLSNEARVVRVATAGGAPIAGAAAGGAVGALIGTAIFPGPGTAIGAVLGGYAGGELGSYAGKYLAEPFGNMADSATHFVKGRVHDVQEGAERVGDFVHDRGRDATRAAQSIGDAVTFWN